MILESPISPEQLSSALDTIHRHAAALGMKVSLVQVDDPKAYSDEQKRIFRQRYDNHSPLLDDRMTDDEFAAAYNGNEFQIDSIDVTRDMMETYGPLVYMMRKGGEANGVKLTLNSLPHTADAITEEDTHVVFDLRNKNFFDPELQSKIFKTVDRIRTKYDTDLSSLPTAPTIPEAAECTIKDIHAKEDWIAAIVDSRKQHDVDPLSTAKLDAMWDEHKDLRATCPNKESDPKK